MILLTGGSGNLGTELKDQFDKLHISYVAPSHEELDINSYSNWLAILRKYEIDTVVHCAAYTGVKRAEKSFKERYNCLRTNGNLHNTWPRHIPFVYISTDYVFNGEKGDYVETDTINPKGTYALSKYLGEQNLGRGSLIIRCSLKSKNWPYSGAWCDQYTTGDFVDVIAPEVALAVKLYREKKIESGVLHIGGKKKKLLDLIRSRFPHVKPVDMPDYVPKDVSLNTDKWKRIKNGL